MQRNGQFVTFTEAM